MTDDAMRVTYFSIGLGLRLAKMSINYDMLARIAIREASNHTLGARVRVSKYEKAAAHARLAKSAGLIEIVVQRLTGVGKNTEVEPNLRHHALMAAIELAAPRSPTRKEAVKALEQLVQQMPPNPGQMDLG